MDLIQYFWGGADLQTTVEGTLRIMITPTHEEIYCWCDEGKKR